MILKPPSKFVIDKVLTISLVNKETGEIVYSAPYDKFEVVLSGVDISKS
jgi:curli biogenesis system outer membrane secretion channel CsgG